jgi:ABC-type nitrate/sulfonate/bicarbonate transport system ATPase subunit
VLCLDEPFGALDAITRCEMQDWLARTLDREPHTVVLVTHDVEEAVMLADRLAVLSPRPGRVVQQFEVELTRPRVRTQPDAIALRERVLSALAQGTPATGGRR